MVATPHETNIAPAINALAQRIIPTFITSLLTNLNA